MAVATRSRHWQEKPDDDHRRADGLPMPNDLNNDDSLLTRASLLVRLKDLDDSDSWGDFYRTYERVVRGLARKRGLSDPEAEEVAQDVFKRIAETIHTFERAPRAGSFRRWLYQLARWRSDDKIRERGRLTVEPMHDREGTGSSDTADLVVDPNDPEEQLEAEARKQLFKAALDRLRRKITPRDLQIFQLLVLEEWPANKVAQFLGITSTLVYVVRHRVATQLRTELESIQKRLADGRPPT